MSKRTNTPIGEVVCPHKGCDQVCKVFKFRPRSESRKTVFTGKHYAECPVHGRIGSDGNPAVTNYILDEGKLWGAKNPGAAQEKSAPAQAPAQKTPEPTPRKTPEKSPSQKQAPRHMAPEPSSKRRWWEPVI